MSRARRVVAAAVAGCLAACGGGPPATTGGDATDGRPRVPNGFAVADVEAGLERPTAARFGPTGRLWVAQQAGRVKVFDARAGTGVLLTADLTARVAGRNNRGLLGLAPDPADETAAYLLFTFPAPPAIDEPVWNDDASNCPDGTTRSCVSTGVLARLSFAADGTPSTTELVRGWCHHHASHAPGDLAFGPNGALYASAGEGSVPELPLDDGTWLPVEQRCNAGAFASRAAAAQRGPGEWAGAVVRFTAADLAAVAGGEQTPDWLSGRATLVAHGLRNPFRMTFRPLTPELWIGDPGWETWEEIDVVPDATGTSALDFGWPCREGPEPAPNYAQDPRCAGLTADPSRAVEPWLAERAGQPLGEREGEVAGCGRAPASISGIAFGPAQWPAPYGAGALYFADFSRGCVFVLPAGADGLPDPDGVQAFWTGSGSVVDLTSGPDGALYATRFAEGAITRILPPGE